MALDKLVDSAQLDSDLGDVADAIRAKSGGSSQLAFPAGFVSAIQSIPTGGGGSFPSVITKIDGGSFTLASDTAGSSHWISHNLGELPKGVIIWTDDSDLRESTAAVAQRYLLCSTIALLEWVSGTTSNAAIPNHLFRNTTGVAGNTGSPLPQSFIGNYFQTTRFANAVSSLYYKAGVEYKWVAYA